LPYGTEAIPETAPVKFVSSGQFVLGLFGRSGTATAFMVVNRNYEQEADVILKVEILGKVVQELDGRTSQWSDAGILDPDRLVKAKLRPGDGKLFQVTNMR
jgi:hypothetical protein